MKKIIGFLNATPNEELPFLTKLTVVYKEDDKYFVQKQLSKQFTTLTSIVCHLKQEDIEEEVQAYLSQGVSTINGSNTYANNDDIPGNKYYFQEVSRDMLEKGNFYPITYFQTYIDEEIKINEENYVYSFAVDGSDVFVGDKDYIYQQIEMILEYPTSSEECNFKIKMLYDLEKYDQLSDIVDDSLESYKDTNYASDWRQKKDDGQKLKLVYQRIKHNI